jgi:hypothetical protein
MRLNTLPCVTKRGVNIQMCTLIYGFL